METKREEGGHSCPQGKCCHACCGCACHIFNMNRGYWLRRWFTLIVGVILAFWVGYKLGEIKGYLRGPSVMMQRRWNYDDNRNFNIQVPVTATQAQ
jgi:hypothetical protein